MTTFILFIIIFPFGNPEGWHHEMWQRPEYTATSTSAVAAAKAKAACDADGKQRSADLNQDRNIRAIWVCG